MTTPVWPAAEADPEADTGREWVLVAQPQAPLGSFIEVNLRLGGYDVCRVADGQAALRAAAQSPAPAAVVVAVDLPDMDRLGLIARLRQDPRTRHAAVLVTGDPDLRAERLLGVAAGADDYLLWPFSADELRTRLHTTRNRVEELRETSPLTGLPGNRRILTELRRWLQRDEPLGVAHADVNDFKSFNDRYGFARGDGLIMLTAEVLCEAVAGCGGNAAFVGHIGGDDFVVLAGPEAIVPVCARTVAQFDARVAALYDAADAAAGGLEVADRRGVRRRVPLTSIALGVATTTRRRFHDPRELLTVAAEMKTLVKRRHRGSQYAVDARGDDVAGGGTAGSNAGSPPAARPGRR